MMYKQVIVVRKDLKMDTGKIAAQVAHASLGAVGKVEKNIAEKWEYEGSKKIVLKVSDLKELAEVLRKIKLRKLPHFVVKDAGRTQLSKGTVTCVGIGPLEEKRIDEITGGLKLL